MSERNQNGSFHHENFHDHNHADIVNPDPYHNHPYRQMGGWLLFFMIIAILGWRFCRLVLYIIALARFLWRFLPARQFL